MIEKHLTANGKLLFTSEYFVLDGALAFAAPVKFGQTLTINQVHSKDHLAIIKWTSLDVHGQEWFSGKFQPNPIKLLEASDLAIGERLVQIFQGIRQLNPEFWENLLTEQQSLEITSKLEFERLFGWGTSSTLVTNLANWSDVDPFLLLEKTFGGSGYDIACAMANQPILYQRRKNGPQLVDFPWSPPFLEQMYLVYLGVKQNSRSGIKRYRSMISSTQQGVDFCSRLTADFLAARDLETIEKVIQAHEQFIAQTLDLPKVKDRFFPDYWGAVKSLGAWGGDFVLVTSSRDEKETVDYFLEKGFTTIQKLKDVVLR